MSDSDDTDLLLLIPPDFFLVQSPDSDDIGSEEGFVLENHYKTVEKSVVNDLITHVNELENRICVIESLDSSRITGLDNSSLCLNQSCSGSNLHQSKLEYKQTDRTFNHNSMSDSVHILSGSIDSIQHNQYLKSRNDFVSPLRPRQPFSLPSTPTNGVHIRPEIQPSRLNDKDVNYSDNLYLEDNSNNKSIDYTETEIITVSDNYKQSSNKQNCIVNCENQSEIQNSKGIHVEKELLGEIDQYLSDVERHGGVFQNKDEVSHTATLYQSNKKPSIDNGLKITTGNSNKFTSNENYNVTQHLDLPEVDRLLKEMEVTQNEIEQKLKLHNPPKRVIEYKSKYYYHSGDNTDSAPGLGFDLKPMCSNDCKTKVSISDERNYKPLIDEPFVKKYVLPLNESDKKTDSNAILSSVDNSSIHNRQSPTSRRRLNMDLRYNVDKEPQLTSNQRNLDHNIKQIYKSANSADSFTPHSVLMKPNQNFEKPNINKHFSPTKFNISKHVGLDSLRDKLSGERNRRVHSVQTQGTVNYTNLPRDIYDIENNPNKGVEQNISTSEQQRLKYERQQAYANIPLHNDGQPIVIENHETCPSNLKPSSKKLLSLTDLWNKEPVFHSDDPIKLRQKLEEERYRRQHCEEMIQSLQYRVLEEEEKLAVAVRVDEEKDKAIIQLTGAWKKLVKHWSELEEQRHDLAKELQAERELSKTKIEEITKDNQSIQEAHAELTKARKQLSQYEAEINVFKEQKEALSAKLKDEKAHNNTLERQKLELQQCLEESKKKEKASIDEARMYGERIEVARTELRALYQGQLEAVVRDKLREFQNQLDAAEATLKAELQAREKLWAEKANDQCKILNDKYKAQLQHVQNQHREEIKSWRVRVVDCERVKSAIQSQLQKETDRRTDIAQRLHGVMETQWRQALKIITNPSAIESNVNPTRVSDQHDIKHMQLQQEENPNVHLDLKNINSQDTSSVVSVAPNDDFPFGEEGKETYRLAEAQPQQKQLKKYIQMLLDRAPGNPVDGSGWNEPTIENPLPSPGSSFGGRWSAFMPLQNDRKTNEQENGSNNTGQYNSKPPWK